jgi:muconate cycloisomerase
MLMKITAVETFAVRIPLKPERRMVSALGRHEVSDYLLVRVSADSGLQGAGEATVMPRWSGETVWGAKALVDHVLGPQLIGLDPADVEALDQRMDQACVHNWFAKSALEMACWDLQGKAAGRPIYELLGGAQRPLTFRCRFSLGAYEPDRAAEVARERVDAGFTTIKVKVGGEPQRDLARVRAVRQAIGQGVDLMIDANCGWDPQTAIDCIRQLEDCRLVLVEQPTPDGDYEALARVRRETGCKILADDICFDRIHAENLLRFDCCDVISVYPGKQGGIRKSLEIVRLCESHGVACSIGSNLEWDVATAAMAHLVVASQNIRVEDYPGDALGPSYHEFPVVRNPLKIQGPLVTLNDGPGLGVEVDWSLVQRHGCPQ